MCSSKHVVFYSQSFVFNLEITRYKVYCAQVPFQPGGRGKSCQWLTENKVAGQAFIND